ncbi:unnamed protein product [Dovyalis caffra]|uniref:5'-3' exoribonuclease n=1 Tax=Dovyalis caffra TaxID=77055 RepID=A0AAV1RB08_9ROSI|nr:unnamed protein product [Dovyalis caffra]
MLVYINKSDFKFESMVRWEEAFNTLMTFLQKWLVNKYPKLVVQAVEEKGELIDTSLPNPNEMEFDNLYLDMNGIIHPCFHPDDNIAADDLSLPTTFDDVFNNTYEYIDHIFSIVRPRKLLYMAIDGVAPRAKMNQQRSRRFRTAKDKEIAEMEEDRLRKEFEMEGKRVLPKQDSEISDSNVITPGTEFMFELSRKLQSYVSSRMSMDPGWKDIKVILSDSNVPGEGEHKIMSFIREQRMLPDYNPNTRHCLYGLDADLIMLALSTHEIHFSILREHVLTQEQQSCSVKSRGWFEDVKTGVLLKDDKIITKKKKPYEFMHVWILREYLELDMKISGPPENFSFDLERIVDDFIFLCFFAGNDFLPHLPSLEIHEGALDLLMTVYKDHFKSLGGYLVDMQRADDPKNGFIKSKRVEKFILQVGSFEERIFKKRSELHERKLRRLCDQVNEENESANLDVRTTSGSSLDHDALASKDLMVANTKELKEKLKTCLRHKADLFKNCDLPDRVKLGKADWRKRYYKEKFSAESPTDIESTRKEIEFLRGLDLKGLAQVKVKFPKGSPFKPFDQLMAVLPPRSVHALPKAYQVLMAEENSPIKDFYPTEFEIDTDGKRFVWQGICKLSFINEERLLAETRKAEKELNKDEAQRNSENIDKLLVRRSNVSDSQFLSLVSNMVSGRPQELIRMDNILGLINTGIGGSIRLCTEDFSDIQGINNTLCIQFEIPKGSLHILRPLERVDFPPKTITEGDIEETHLWHEYPGNRNTRLPIQNNDGNSFLGNERDMAPKWTPSNYSSKITSEPVHKGAGAGSGAGRSRGNVSHEVRDFHNLKISESTQGSSRSYANVQSANNSFWPSTNVATYNNRNNAWCQNPQFHANGSSQSGGGGQWRTTNWNYAGQFNRHLAANPSSRAPGTGRGDYAPRSSYTGPWRVSRNNEQNEFMGYHSRG